VNVRRDHSGTDTIDVLHVAQPTMAGVPHVVAGLVEEQVGRGWRVTVAAPEGGDLGRLVRAAGGRHVSWTAGRSPDHRSVWETRSLGAIVQSVQPQVVHLHSSKAGLAGRLALRGRLPTVFQPHAWSFYASDGVMARLAIGWERFATRWADAVVCVSEGERAAGEAVGIRAQCFVVPNGVDLARWTMTSPEGRTVARRDLGLAESGPLVVCVGRLCRQKGQEILLAAWSDLAPRFPAATLVLVGDGPDRNVLQAVRAPATRLVGWSDDVSSWIAASDLVVIPSLWEAGLTLVAMEAMARGRSVVATDVVGMRAGLRGGCGAVVPIGDASALAAAMDERLGDPALREAEGRAGRRIVEKDYARSLTAERISGVYRAALSRRVR
jgi:glycosyltransferase involved in cell wall biosynthesis